MHEILCYGDSNTWGYIPGTGKRYDRDTRWTGVMSNLLGDGFRVVEEGLNGRTTVWEDPVEGDKNGMKQFTPCLESHKPLSMVIIMLGTNDLKQRFSVSAFDIACSVGRLVDMVQRSGTGVDGNSPEVLLLAPPRLGKISEFGEMFEGGKAKSEKLGMHYEDISREYGCHFFDTARLIESSDIDGVHLTVENHKLLGIKVAEIIKSIIRD